MKIYTYWRVTCGDLKALRSQGQLEINILTPGSAHDGDNFSGSDFLDIWQLISVGSICECVFMWQVLV